MLNKKVLLGCLVAGAMVLPMTANAGVVSGACVTCHSMHDSQGGVTQGALAPTLLKAGGCEGCHAGGTNDANGVDLGQFGAPQVDDNVRPNLAGYFTPGANEITHNIPGDLTGMATDSNLGNSAPGSGFGNETCAGCHTLSSGGHHGAGGTAYRMLFDLTGSQQVADSTFGNSGTTTVDTSATTYDSDDMNAVCNRCHGDFHGSAVDEQWNGSAWIRHPTDIRMVDANASNYDYDANYTNNANFDVIPLGTGSSAWSQGTVGTRTLMCITCHFSHGSGNNDLLRFAYNDGSANEAGDNTASSGCESCHDYSGVITQNGM